MSRWIDDLSEIPVLQGSALPIVATGLIIYNLYAGGVVIVQTFQGKMDPTWQGYAIGFLALVTSATLFSLLITHGDE
jgi:hypothetical protein